MTVFAIALVLGAIVLCGLIVWASLIVASAADDAEQELLRQIANGDAPHLPATQFHTRGDK